MADLPTRLARAGAHASLCAQRPALGSAALVLVDAPCSGSGSWARKPEAKWRLTPDRMTALATAQADALASGAAATARGGALVYATCSLFRAENEDAVAAFSATHPTFQPLDMAALWRRADLSLEQPPILRAGRAGLRLSPSRHGTEGFFIMAWRRDH